MVLIRKRSVLAGLKVHEVMRRQVIQLPPRATLAMCINRLVKNKISAVLVVDDDAPVGVVSKTDLIGAFYAGLPIETEVQDIMVGQPLCCLPDESLESAIDRMHGMGVHRLYVTDPDSRQVIGMVAYPDIVGLLYRYCRACVNSSARGRKSGSAEVDLLRLRVSEVMTPGTHSCSLQTSLAGVVEQLTALRFGAMLVVDGSGFPRGVVSKSDLVLAFNHGLGLDHSAEMVMHSPVVSCDCDDLLATALQQMLLKDVQRLFVHRQRPADIIGVLSLSDSARFRSGSCRACISGRLIAGE